MSCMKKLILSCLSAIAALTLYAQASDDSGVTESSLNLNTSSGAIMGTLMLPASAEKIPVVLLIAGSGPTDRNGNSPMTKNESLRLLSRALVLNGIATLRYDKRGIAASTAAGKPEADLLFDDYVVDAKGWIALLKADPRFSKVIVAGHSEGALIGMIAASGAADGFVSIAGAGKPADLILKEQLAQQPPMIKEPSYAIIDSLAQGKKVQDVNPMLYTLFRPSVQPYLISWFKYNPVTEMARLNMPVLIVQGTKDLQITTSDAALLAAAKPGTQPALIENMNHVLKIIEGDRNENIASYGNPSLPVSTALVKLLTDFVLERKQ